MYNEQLDKLIEMALMDGELTEKEKQVLFKKAEAMGVDLDEFEMVLDAKLYEKQQEGKKHEAPDISPAAPKSTKFGDVKKCPACGAMVQSFQTKCTDCGTEFSGVEANASIQKLFQMLNEVEGQRKEKGVLGQLLVNSGHMSDATDSKKRTIISSFPVPNTKEDILEFLSLALPLAKKKGNFISSLDEKNRPHNSFVPIWFAKCEQIIMKARFSMKDDKKTLDEINSYAAQLKIK